jgi:hypothetical protein
MNSLKRFGTFWYHFIIGDDWQIAAGIVLGLGLTALIVYQAHLQGWWLMPIIAVSTLTLSLWSATRRL